MARALVLCLALCIAIPAVLSQLPQSDDPNAFWYGTQELNCLKSKDMFRVKRSAGIAGLEAIERSTIQYIHRLLFYRGEVFEWGAGTRGYHFGPTASIVDCPVVWEERPAGSSRCELSVLERYTRRYRVRYGGYNMVTNNCHHYVNRLAIILQSGTCSIGEDRWLSFSRKFGVFLNRFMAVFSPGSEAHPGEHEQEGNPHNVNQWPIVKWYRK